MLQVTNAVLTTGGLLAPVFVGTLVSAAVTPAIGYEQSFMLTGVIMGVVGLIACVAINQQRDRKKLGLDIV